MSEEKYTLKQYAAMEGGHTLGDENNGLEFIQSLGEARMFKTRQQLSKEGARGLTDHLFVGLMSLYAMSNDYKYAPVAKEYARKTGMYGGFSRPSPSGTDIYQTLHALLKPEGFTNTEADKLLFNKVQISQPRIRQFLKQLQSGNMTAGQAQSFFYKLEGQLAIQDPKLRAARRLVGDWTKLTTQQQQLAATQLNKHYRINARRSDLMMPFKKYSEEHGLNLKDGEKKSIGKRIMQGAAAFAAGYTAGKLTGMDQD